MSSPITGLCGEYELQKMQFELDKKDGKVPFMFYGQPYPEWVREKYPLLFPKKISVTQPE